MGKNRVVTKGPLSRIQPLYVGHYSMPATDTRFPSDRIIVRAFLIEHRDGPFLMDTGFSAADRSALETFAPVHIRPIRSVLAEHGVRAEDVRLIANCHFHSDHSGGNHEFPGVPRVHPRAIGRRLQRRPARGARGRGRAAAGDPHHPDPWALAGPSVARGGNEGRARHPGWPGVQLLVRLCPAALLVRARPAWRAAWAVSGVGGPVPGARPVAGLLRPRHRPLGT